MDRVFSLIFVFLALPAISASAQTISGEMLQRAEGRFMLYGIRMVRDQQGRVVQISMSGNHARRELLNMLPEFAFLEELALERDKFDRDDIAPLLKLPALKKLSITGDPSDEAWAMVGGLAKLEELTINYTYLNKESMAGLGKLARLRHLSLSNVNAAASGMVNLRNLNALKILEIGNFTVFADDAPFAESRHFGERYEYKRLKDNGLLALPDLASLETLYLNKSLITTTGLKRLKDFRSLRKLWIESDLLYRLDAETLRGFTALRQLSLKAPINDADFAALAALPVLESLILKDATITGEGWKDIGEFRRLTSLSIQNSQATDEDLECIRDNTILSCLVISSPNITDRGLESIAQMPWLRELSVGGEKITDAGIAHLATYSRLETLCIDAPQVTLRGVLQLAYLHGLKYLWTATPEISEQTLVQLKAAMPRCDFDAEDMPEE